MSGPVLTPADVTLLQSIKADTQSQIAGLNQSIAHNEALRESFEEMDAVYMKFWNWFDADVVKPYELEARMISGNYIADPITNTDIEDIYG